MIDKKALQAVEASDTDALLRIIDGWCAARTWDDLVDLRPHLAAAGERGKQLWGVDEHIRYRLALEGPNELAGAVVAEGPARFTLGPLTEVLAQSHTWDAIAPHLGFGPHRTLVAQERSLRGDTVDHEDLDLDVPLAAQVFEPVYQLAEYASDRAEFPSPGTVRLDRVKLPKPGSPALDPATLEALEQLVGPWVTQSTGRADVRCVEGDALSAIAALGPTTAGLAPTTPAAALAWMAWAGASGGAYGRRRGAAVGRVSAWWAAAAMLDLDWPVEPTDLGEALEELDWFLFSDGDESGWSLRLAVQDVAHGLAWAISAIDLPPT